jgi:hypothetical protein
MMFEPRFSSLDELETFGVKANPDPLNASHVAYFEL